MGTPPLRFVRSVMSLLLRGNTAIKNWINRQMQGRSCLVVLVGASTADRRWINYEIIQAWGKGMGVAGIYIHAIKKSTRIHIVSRG